MQLKGDRHINNDEGISVRVWRHGSGNRHSHEFVELVYVLDGRAHHTLGDETMELKKGDLFIMDVGVEHEFRVEDGEKIAVQLLVLPRVSHARHHRRQFYRPRVRYVLFGLRGRSRR